MSCLVSDYQQVNYDDFYFFGSRASTNDWVAITNFDNECFMDKKINVTGFVMGYDLFVVVDGNKAVYECDINNNIVGANNSLRKIFEVAPEEKIVCVEAGHSHRLLLTDQGVVYGWGSSVFGQLGNGDNQYHSAPVRNTTIASPVLAIRTGRHHSMIMTNDFKLYGFGDNEYGELGIGNYTVAISNPTESLVNANEVKEMVVSRWGYHTLLILKDGSLKAFGYNDQGQLGLGAGVPNQHTPQVVSFFKPGTVMAAKAVESCSVVQTVDYKLYVFGRHGSNEPNLIPTGLNLVAFGVATKGSIIGLDAYDGFKIFSIPSTEVEARSISLDGYHHHRVVNIYSSSNGKTNFIVTRKHKGWSFSPVNISKFKDIGFTFK